MIGMSSGPGEGYDYEEDPESGNETDTFSQKELVMQISDPEQRQQYFLDAFCQLSPMTEFLAQGPKWKEAFNEAVEKGEVIRETGHPPAEKVKDSGLSVEDILEFAQKYPDYFKIGIAMETTDNSKSYILKTTSGQLLPVMINQDGRVMIDIPGYSDGFSTRNN